MRYDVVWQPSAIDDFADLDHRATDKPVVSAATDASDRDLARHPAALGESREEGIRVYLHASVGVEYTVIEGDRRVIVGRVWRYKVKP